MPSKILELSPLQALLSKEASIVWSTEPEYVKFTERWSHFNEPLAAAVVNVACERDIEETVRFATTNKIPFIAQSGGHGWTSSLKTLSSNGLIINLRALNSTTFDLSNGTATLSGGCLTGDVLTAAYAANAQLVIGSCNTVGAIPPMLGGGLSNLVSLYGLAIDNFLSLRLIPASGTAITVSATENADLWYGVRGAGHNFGIVSELTVRCYPAVNGGMHWSPMLVFPTEKLEAITDVMNSGILGPGMSCLFVWARIPPTGFQPVIAAFPWFAGPEEEARKRFKPLIDLGPLMEEGGMVPYTEINKPSDQASVKGGRKPTYSVGLEEFDKRDMRTVLDSWVEFTEVHPEAKESVVLVECYNYEKAREVDESETAFPHRKNVQFEVLTSMNYSDEKLDQEVEVYGRKFRDTLHKGGKGHVYVNFASGDETKEQIYGSEERLSKLRSLKQKWDPEGVFSFYNPI